MNRHGSEMHDRSAHAAGAGENGADAPRPVPGINVVRSLHVDPSTWDAGRGGRVIP